ncbi:uncharacterized protein [Haliotis cracherodii]|uniref:uncharacterized protein n=1 Tax=Haliotis cracherodii TaxID=6455 RepID=UPI0039E892C2
MAQQQSGSSRNEKKRRLEDIDISSGSISQNIDTWARFLVIEAADKLPIKLNPFAISKAVSGICGEVKNVTRLRSGSLLVECARRQQSLNLLSISTFANIEVAVSVHRTLNSCRGIVRDRARCLSDMSEDEIATELEDQAVTAVKRFTIKKDGVITNTNTYLMTFAQTSLPQSIKAGYMNIGVDVYVPNPLRCYKCQHFGHGQNPVITLWYVIVVDIPTISLSSSGSQTEIQSQKPSHTSVKQPVVVHLSNKEKKKLKKKQLPIVPSPSEVPLQNSFGPLDMEVTLSSQDRRGSSSSSHSRERSPIEPP